MNKPNARIYQRVSTKGQDLTRQDALRAEAEAKGYRVVATYSEKESGTTEKRPELQRMLADLGTTLRRNRQSFKRLLDHHNLPLFSPGSPMLKPLDELRSKAFKL